MRNSPLWLLLVLAGPARAAYDDLGVGARAPGMSDAFVAVADDVYSVYYNPAGLGVLERPQFGTSYTKLHLGLTDKSDLASQFVGYAHPLPGGRRGAIGASWSSFSLGSLYREQALGLSYGRGVGGAELGLHAGGTLKYLHSGLGDLPEASNAFSGIALSGQADPALARRGQSALDADVGLLWRLARQYSVGLQAMHVPQPNVAFQAGQTDRLPLLLKTGFAYRSLLSSLVAQVDTQRAPDGGRDGRFSVGAERWFPRLLVGEFGARGGFAVGTRERREATAGLSYRTRRLGVDYAFGMPLGGVETAAGSHRVAVSFRFGSSTESDESVELVLEAMRHLKRGESAPLVRILGRGLSVGQKAALEELLAEGRALEQQGRYLEALDKLSAALSMAPAEKEVLAKYGRLNYIAQQIPVLAEHKTDPLQAAMHQGLLAYLAGKDDLAVSRLAAALRLKPGYKELDVFLAGLEGLTGRRRPTVTLAAKPRNYRLEAALTRADTAVQEGRYREAVELSLSVVGEDDGNGAAWQNLGTAYFALKDYERSLAAWRRALALETSGPLKRELRGYIASVERAMRSADVVKAPPKPVPAPVPDPRPERPRLAPEAARALLDQALDHYTRRDLAEARRLLRRLLDAEPEHAEARKALRRIEEELR